MSAEKYRARVRNTGSLVCVGLDPDINQIPERFRALDNPQFAFNKSIIDETHEYAAAYKPNSAFYEARGTQGMHELQMTLAYLQSEYPDIYTILDAKRGDIGNTNEQYARFAFDWLDADALTVHPYLGGAALEPFFARTDRTVFVMCRNSNTTSGEMQQLLVHDEPLWKVLARHVADTWNTRGNCGLVMSALYPEELVEVRTIVGDMMLLVPGVGAQGGDAARVATCGRSSGGGDVVISASRSIMYADNPGVAARLLRDAAAAATP